jgi:hypothetical protein
MAAFLKSGEVTLRCLEFTKLTLNCSACKSLFRFEPIRPLVSKHAASQSASNGYYPIPNHFCPVCGSPAVAEFNPELDYWELISSSLDLPVGLTLQIYSHWLKDKFATAKFIDYVMEIQQELANA